MPVSKYWLLGWLCPRGLTVIRCHQFANMTKSWDQRYNFPKNTFQISSSWTIIWKNFFQFLTVFFKFFLNWYLFIPNISCLQFPQLPRMQTVDSRLHLNQLSGKQKAEKVHCIIRKNSIHVIILIFFYMTMSEKRNIFLECNTSDK